MKELLFSISMDATEGVCRMKITLLITPNDFKSVLTANRFSMTGTAHPEHYPCFVYLRECDDGYGGYLEPTYLYENDVKNMLTKIRQIKTHQWLADGKEPHD